MSSVPEVPVYSTGASIGGVEAIGRHLVDALSAGGYRANLHFGYRSLTAPRPRGRWFALTWKMHALVSAGHPGVRRHGVILLHGAELTRDTSSLQRRLMRRSLESSERLLSVSPLTLDLVPDHLRTKTSLIGPPIVLPIPRTPDGVDRRAGPEPDRALRLLTVARALRRKGHDTAIAVARELARDTPVRLVIVGPGPDLRRLRALAVGAPDGLDIEVRGSVEESEKAALYEWADALLFLSRPEGTEYEGLGLVVLEAAARGCPAVVLECGGSKFGLDDGSSGLLLPTSAPISSIADAVRTVVDDAAFRSRAAAFAGQFDLGSWQERVHMVVSGRDPGWQWPTATDTRAIP